MRINVVAAIIRRDGRILITRRPDNVHLGGLWEFPGGKVEPGESLTSALEREIKEELGIEVSVECQIFAVEHDYPTKRIRLHFFECVISRGEPCALNAAELRWAAPQELDNFQFPAADSALIDKLCGR